MGVKIVLAEDDADLRALYVGALRRAGHAVWEAADGGEAIAQVRALVPDLLLLDLWMPVFNGLEVLELLSEDPRSVGLKVVVLTNSIDGDTSLEGFARGIDDYWIKDLSLADLCARVDSLMRFAGPQS
jgi:DNA-binding response OmpR family regulator